MQDVTGRFITNAISQLKRRAASLYLQELQEYKVQALSELPRVCLLIICHCLTCSVITEVQDLERAQLAARTLPATRQASKCKPWEAICRS